MAGDKCEHSKYYAVVKPFNKSFKPSQQCVFSQDCLSSIKETSHDSLQGMIDEVVFATSCIDQFNSDSKWCSFSSRKFVSYCSWLLYACIVRLFHLVHWYRATCLLLVVLKQILAKMEQCTRGERSFVCKTSTA